MNNLRFPLVKKINSEVRDKWNSAYFDFDNIEVYTGKMEIYNDAKKYIYLIHHTL